MGYVHLQGVSVLLCLCCLGSATRLSGQSRCEIFKGLVGGRYSLVPESNRSGMSERGVTVSAPDLGVPRSVRKMYEKAVKKLDKDPEASRRLLDKVIAVHPRFPQAQTMLGLAYFKLNQTAASAEALQRAIELNPDSSRAHFLMGEVRMEQQRYSEAETQFLEGLRVDPRDWRGLYDLTRCYHKMGQVRRAFEYGMRAHEAQGAPPVMHLVMVDLYAERNDKAAALAELRDFARADPRSPYLPEVNKRIAELTR